jgi:hypothetical protein
MGTLTCQQIADRAWTILNDANGVRWTSAEVLRWVNDGQRAVVLVLPSAYTRAAKPMLRTGTRQTLPVLGLNDGLQPLSVVRNFDGAGEVSGPAITAKSRAYLDDAYPDWHSDEPGPAVHWFFDPQDPMAFYVWPPAPGNLRAEVVYSAVPPELPSIGNPITLPDIYANALQFYLLFRAFSKSATYTKSPQQADRNYQLFLQELGVKDSRVKTLDANLQQVQNGGGVSGNG